jgi:hypothetical protein
MHTLIVIGVGFLLLAVCLALGGVAGGHAALPRAALVFIPLWLVGAAVNMAIGVKRAGYSVGEELPVLLLVFAVPSLVALSLWWRLR